MSLELQLRSNYDDYLFDDSLNNMIQEEYQSLTESIPVEGDVNHNGSWDGYKVFPFISNLHTGLDTLINSNILPKLGSIIDLGCGKGNVLYEAIGLGFESAYGIDINPKLIDEGSLLLKDYPQIQMEVGNILEWSPKQDYDLIYLYEPMVMMELRERLLERIYNVTKPGQHVLYHYCLLSLIYRFKDKFEWVDAFANGGLIKRL